MADNFIWQKYYESFICSNCFKEYEMREFEKLTSLNTQNKYKQALNLAKKYVNQYAQTAIDYRRSQIEITAKRFPQKRIYGIPNAEPVKTKEKVKFVIVG